MPGKPEKPALTVVGTATPPYPPPPKKLGKSGTSLWVEVQAEYDIADVGGREMLLNAARLRTASSACRRVSTATGRWFAPGAAPN
jgi:hypothetical protein